MSDAKKAAPAHAEGEPPKKKGKLMLFIIIGVLILVLSGVGAVLMIKKNAAAHEEGEEGEDVSHEVKPKKKEKKKSAEPSAPPVFHKFEKPFVAKLLSEQGDSYIQIEMQLKILDAKTADSVKTYDPELKHKITLLLMGKKTAEVSGAPAVQKLSNEIRVAINSILNPPPPSKKSKANLPPEEPSDEADPEDPVQAVLFTSFIIQ